MTTPPPDTRSLLLDALQREGIAYPTDRLPEAIEDCGHLQGFLALIRAEAQANRGRADD